MAIRTPYEIAADIRRDMNPNSSAWTYCKPYVEALEESREWCGWYHHETVSEIGLRFLCNAGTWRGAVARRVKLEIHDALQHATKERGAV